MPEVFDITRCLVSSLVTPSQDFTAPPSALYCCQAVFGFISYRTLFCNSYQFLVFPVCICFCRTYPIVDFRKPSTFDNADFFFIFFTFMVIDLSIILTDTTLVKMVTLSSGHKDKTDAAMPGSITIFHVLDRRT